MLSQKLLIFVKLDQGEDSQSGDLISGTQGTSYEPVTRNSVVEYGFDESESDFEASTIKGFDRNQIFENTDSV